MGCALKDRNVTLRDASCRGCCAGGTTTGSVLRLIGLLVRPPRSGTDGDCISGSDSVGSAPASPASTSVAGTAKYQCSCSQGVRAKRNASREEG